MQSAVLIVGREHCDSLPTPLRPMHKGQTKDWTSPLADRMASLTWGVTPTTPGWHAVMADYARLPFPDSRHSKGARKVDTGDIRALDGPVFWPIHLPAELRMQAHQPLRQRLRVVSHGIERRGADGNMAAPDVEAIEARQRSDGTAPDGVRDGCSLGLSKLGPTIERAGGVHARPLLVDVQRVDHGLRLGTSSDRACAMHRDPVDPQRQGVGKDDWALALLYAEFRGHGIAAGLAKGKLCNCLR